MSIVNIDMIPSLDGLEKVLLTINPETNEPDVFVCKSHSKSMGLLNYPEIVNDYVSITGTSTRAYDVDQLAAISHMANYKFKAFVRYR